MIYLTLFNSNDDYLSKASELISKNISYDNDKIHYLTKLKYKTSDNKVIELLDVKSLVGVDYDMKPIVNTYSDENGIMCFDGILTALGLDTNEGMSIAYHVFPVFTDSTLTSIELPDSITSVYYGSFTNCSGVTSITLNDNLYFIGKQSFSGCTSLTDITIPDSVNIINDQAFFGCSGLTTLTIPDSVISIGNNAFYNCTSLSSITLGSGLTSIGGWCFGMDTHISAIYYTGKMSDWSKINIGDGWLYQNTIVKVIHCSDGDVSL